MPYDKKSFLSGLAAGRNARSWPRQYGDNYFIFTLAADAGVQIRSPFLVLDGWIHWGDGTAERMNNNPEDVPQSEIAGYGSVKYHTYSESGEYTVILEGNLRKWGASRHNDLYAADYPALTSVITPFPISMKGITDANNMFAMTRNLRKIPDGLLDNISDSIESAWAMFYKSGISKIPDSFFRGCKLTEPDAVAYLFEDSGLSEIPPDLFAYTPEIGFLDQVFTGTPVRSIPSGLLAPLEGLYFVRGLFAATQIREIPSLLFVGNPLITDFQSCFYNCAAASGPAPLLWEQFPDAFGFNCFYGCTGLSNYADIPRSWGGPFENA